MPVAAGIVGDVGMRAAPVHLRCRYIISTSGGPGLVVIIPLILILMGRCIGDAFDPEAFAQRLDPTAPT
jgi:hypothetical protein